jgi:Xaa-Pro aminopeptidase
LSVPGSSFTEEEFADRHRRVREQMEREGLDAIICYSNAKAKGVVWWLGNYYVRFTGAQTRKDGSYFQFGSCAILFPREGEPQLVTDQPWDVGRAKELSIFGDTRYADNFGVDFGEVIAREGYRKVGIDNWFLYPAMHYLPLVEKAPDTTFEPTQLVEQTYRIKSPAEIEIMRRSEAAAVAAVQAGMDAVDVGVSEFEFGLACEYALRKHGELELAGGSIICGGVNTSNASGLPMHEGSHVMKAGEWAMFDICPSYGGYAGDISRMRVAGKLSDLDPHLRKMYDTTLRMNQEVIAAVKPGVTPWQLNQLAMRIAEEGGFGDQKIDLLGHSLGPDIHDPPDYYYDDEPLEENMTVTIEPCLLEEGVAGTRVEDVVVITADGCEVLSEGAPRELLGSQG